MNKYVLAVVTALGGALAMLVVNHAFAGTETYRQLNLFGDVFERVKNDYVREVKDDELVESAINGMLNALDPHSSFYDAREWRAMLDDQRSGYTGIGATIANFERGGVRPAGCHDVCRGTMRSLRQRDLVAQLDVLDGIEQCDALGHWFLKCLAA